MPSAPGAVLGPWRREFHLTDARAMGLHQAMCAIPALSVALAATLWATMVAPPRRGA